MGTVRIICFRGSGKPVVQDKTTPHAKLYISLIYTRLAWAFVSSIPVPHEILPEFLKRDKAKRFLWLICHQQVFQPVSATNVINFKRSTNVFRDVVEQIYSIIDNPQDYIGGSQTRLSCFWVSNLLRMPQNSLITMSTTPTAPYHSIIFHLSLGDTWYFHPLYCKPSMILHLVITWAHHCIVKTNEP